MTRVTWRTSNLHFSSSHSPFSLNLCIYKKIYIMVPWAVFTLCCISITLWNGTSCASWIPDNNIGAIMFISLTACTSRGKREQDKVHITSYHTHRVLLFLKSLTLRRKMQHSIAWYHYIYYIIIPCWYTKAPISSHEGFNISIQMTGSHRLT